MKYYFQIICSCYTTGRIRVSWHPTFAEIPSSFSDGEGDFISKVVDFKGDTNFCVSIPYLQQRMYSEVFDTWAKGDTGSNGNIAISIVNAVTSSTSVGDSTVQINVFIAGDKDMDFIQIRDRYVPAGYSRTIFNTQGALPTGWVAQGMNDTDTSVLLEEIFQADFPSILPAKRLEFAFVCEGEKVRDVLTICHRFTQYSPTGTAVSFANGTWNQFSIDGITTPNNDSAFNLFANWFMYSRGSMNWKFIRDYSATAPPNGVIQVTQSFWNSYAGFYDDPTTISNPWGRNGTIVEDTVYRPSVEFRQPYVSSFAYVENQQCRIDSQYENVVYARFVSLGGSTNLNASWTVWYAVGDDWSFGWPLGVPILAFTQL